jgi:UrcA family protein
MGYDAFRRHSSSLTAHLTVSRDFLWKYDTYWPNLAGMNILISYSSSGWEANKRGETYMEVRKITCMTAATLAGSLLVFSATSPVKAQQPLLVERQRNFDPELQRVVHYGDLNLTNLSGRNTLIRRVGFAVNNLCAMNQSWRPLETTMAVRRCSRSAWDSASPQITAAFASGTLGNYVAAAAVTISAVR